MALIDHSQLSLADTILGERKQKRTFLAQINTLINWKPIEAILANYYPKGLSLEGRKAYPPLLLFKMSLLQTWYGLSDYAVEEQVLDSFSFMKFCGLSFQDNVPDHSVLSRFRKHLTEKNAYQGLIKEINKQLEQAGILVKQGAIVDASITPTPRKPKGKKAYALPQKGESAEQKLEEVIKKGVDKEAAWVKKGGMLYYGYKKHAIVEDKHGLVLGIHTTSAKEHETKELGKVIDKQDLLPGIELLADKGYSSRENEKLLRSKGLKCRIQRKKEKGKEKSPWIGLYNKLIGKRRYKVERVFGSIKRWFSGGVARYVGLAKTHSQHLLEGLCYNLYRAPNIFIKLSLEG
jgi:IS5 family transposase